MANDCPNCGCIVQPGDPCGCDPVDVEALHQEIEHLRWQLSDLRTSHADVPFVDEARGRLSSLASALSAGVGDESTTLLQYVDRVNEGFEAFQRDIDRLLGSERSAHQRRVQSLRAKLMRERADGHERFAYLIGIVATLNREANPGVDRLLARARRLRAEADRMEVANG